MCDERETDCSRERERHCVREKDTGWEGGFVCERETLGGCGCV